LFVGGKLCVSLGGGVCKCAAETDDALETVGGIEEDAEHAFIGLREGGKSERGAGLEALGCITRGHIDGGLGDVRDGVELCRGRRGFATLCEKGQRGEKEGRNERCGGGELVRHLSGMVEKEV
jgi:hypothetical protein